VPVEDRLVDVLESQLIEPGALEDGRGGFCVAERERVRASSGDAGSRLKTARIRLM
jgi:hypothetical protein